MEVMYPEICFNLKKQIFWTIKNIIDIYKPLRIERKLFFFVFGLFILSNFLSGFYSTKTYTYTLKKLGT